MRFEVITAGERLELIGRALRSGLDPLLKFHQKEMIWLSLKTNIAVVPDVVERITRNLDKYIDGESVGMMKLALRELLYNAIEHGDLNISYKKKSDALRADTYFELLAVRKSLRKTGKRRSWWST